jgi:ADP-ribose pyrophosphatase
MKRRSGYLQSPAGAKARNTARILRSSTLHHGKVFDLRRDEVVEPGGLRTTREIVVHPGSVVVLPVLPDGRIVLVRQYRHAAGQFLWELVAGRKEPGERRELLEETGYRARRYRVFLDVYPAPGFLSERMFILLAEGLTAGAAQPEDDEKIASRAFPVAELQKMIRSRRLRDAKSVAGILYYLRFLRRS